MSSLKAKYPHLGLARLCALFGYSRQAYYQQSWALADKSLEEQLVLQLVKGIRREQPRLGTRKLFVLLEEPLLAAGVWGAMPCLICLPGNAYWYAGAGVVPRARPTATAGSIASTS